MILKLSENFATVKSRIISRGPLGTVNTVLNSIIVTLYSMQYLKYRYGNQRKW